MFERFQYQMSFLKHLEELRGRLIICVVWFLLCAGIGGYFFYQPVLDVLRKPMESVSIRPKPVLTFTQNAQGFWAIDPPADKSQLPHYSRDRLRFVFNDQTVFEWGHNYQSSLFYFNILTPYMLMLKAAVLIGVALSSLMWIYQLWLFIAPGMTRRERRLMRPIFISSCLLFPLGAGFAYFVLAVAIRFLTNFQFDWLEPRLDVARYLSFVITFMLVFGLLFQTPLIIVLLVRIGAVTTAQLRQYRKYFFLAIMVIAALLTPDPFTMFIMGAPLYLLFEASIWVGVIIEPQQRGAHLGKAP